MAYKDEKIASDMVFGGSFHYLLIQGLVQYGGLRWYLCEQKYTITYRKQVDKIIFPSDHLGPKRKVKQ